MKQALIKELYRNTDSFVDQQVQLSGWIRTIRDSKTFGFIELNDGSFFKGVQIVFDEQLGNFKEITKLPISSSIKIEEILFILHKLNSPLKLKQQIL